MDETLIAAARQAFGGDGVAITFGAPLHDGAERYGVAQFALTCRSNASVMTRQQPRVRSVPRRRVSHAAARRRRRKVAFVVGAFDGDFYREE